MVAIVTHMAKTWLKITAKANWILVHTHSHTIFDIALLSMLCFHHLLEQHNLNCGGVVWLQIDIFCWWLFSRMDICGCGCGCGVYICAISAFEYYGLCYYFIYCRQSTTNNAILFRICFLWLSLSLSLSFAPVRQHQKRRTFITLPKIHNSFELDVHSAVVVDK